MKRRVYLCTKEAEDLRAGNIYIFEHRRNLIRLYDREENYPWLTLDHERTQFLQEYFKRI